MRTIGQRIAAWFAELDRGLAVMRNDSDAQGEAFRRAAAGAQTARGLPPAPYRTARRG